MHNLLDASDSAAVAAFIRANTRILAPPLVPELRLHIAEESLPIWQKTEEELGQMNLPPPFWAFAWAGGQALARYLLDNQDIARERRVLDLGTGSGLTGIAAGLSGARSVLAADIDPIALCAATLNASLNGSAIATTREDVLDARPAGFDLILVGDLFYERALAERVLAFIAQAKNLGASVLVGDPQRSYFPRGQFTCLGDYRVPVTRELEDSEIKRTSVWLA